MFPVARCCRCARGSKRVLRTSPDNINNRALIPQPATGSALLRTTDDGRQQRGKLSFTQIASTVQKTHARTHCSSTAGRKAGRACCFQEANKGPATRAASARVEHETRSSIHLRVHGDLTRLHPPLTAYLGHHVRGSAATERTLCVSYRSAVHISAAGVATIWSAKQCSLLELAAIAAEHYECFNLPAVLPRDRSFSISATDLAANAHARVTNTLITRLWQWE